MKRIFCALMLLSVTTPAVVCMDAVIQQISGENSDKSAPLTDKFQNVIQTMQKGVFGARDARVQLEQIINDQCGKISELHRSVIVLNLMTLLLQTPRTPPAHQQ